MNLNQLSNVYQLTLSEAEHYNFIEKTFLLASQPTLKVYALFTSNDPTTPKKEKSCSN